MDHTSVEVGRINELPVGYLLKNIVTKTVRGFYGVIMKKGK